MIAIEEIVCIEEIISSAILPSREVWMSLVVGHRAKVMMLRLWQVVMEVAAKVHREFENVASIVYLVVFIIIVFLLLVRLFISASFRGLRLSWCFSFVLFLFSLFGFMLFV